MIERLSILFWVFPVVLFAQPYNVKDGYEIYHKDLKVSTDFVSIEMNGIHAQTNMIALKMSILNKTDSLMILKREELMFKVNGKYRVPTKRLVVIEPHDMVTIGVKVGGDIP